MAARNSEERERENRSRGGRGRGWQGGERRAAPVVAGSQRRSLAGRDGRERERERTRARGKETESERADG